MLATIVCIHVIYSLVEGGTVSFVLGSWDASPYLQVSVGYGAYWGLLGWWCLYFCKNKGYTLAWVYLMCACHIPIWGWFRSTSLSLKEWICTLHTLCFIPNKYIITCVEVNFIAGFVIYKKKDLVRSRYILCSIWLILFAKSQVAASRVNVWWCPYPKYGRINTT